MRIVLLLGLLAFASGCDSSRHPIYGSIPDDTVFDPKLIGKWEFKDEGTGETGIIVVSRVGETKQYRLTLPGDKKGETEIVEGYLVSLGEDRILDINRPGKPLEHKFLRVRRVDDTKMSIDIPDLRILRDRPQLVSHQRFKTTTDKSREKARNSDLRPDIELTATTAELRTFFRDHSKTIWKDELFQLRKVE